MIIILYNLIPPVIAWAGEVELHIGMHSIRATIANTPLSRDRGLMQNNYLCEDCGMLFVFPKAGKYNFWMKNTPLPLSIAFIADDGSILNIDEMQANTTNIHRSRGNALYALEMKRNWFAAHTIKTKDRVQGLQQAPKGQ